MEPNKSSDERFVGFKVSNAGSMEETELKENMELLGGW